MLKKYNGPAIIFLENTSKTGTNYGAMLMNWKQATEQVFQDEQNPEKIVHAISISKQMFACFSEMMPLQGHSTVNYKWYTKICQSKFLG